jgi:hypothetical protein
MHHRSRVEGDPVVVERVFDVIVPRYEETVVEVPEVRYTERVEYVDEYVDEVG